MDGFKLNTIRIKKRIPKNVYQFIMCTIWAEYASNKTTQRYCFRFFFPPQYFDPLLPISIGLTCEKGEIYA